MPKLKDVVPHEFFQEFMDTPAAKLLDVEVINEHEHGRWQGKHKNVFCWWKLENGKAVSWNENAGRGWSFPVININSKGKNEKN